MYIVYELGALLSMYQKDYIIEQIHKKKQIVFELGLVAWSEKGHIYPWSGTCTY